MEKTVTLGLLEYQQIIRDREEYFKIQRQEYTEGKIALKCKMQEFEAKWHQSEKEITLLKDYNSELSAQILVKNSTIIGLENELAFCKETNESQHTNLVERIAIRAELLKDRERLDFINKRKYLLHVNHNSNSVDDIRRTLDREMDSEVSK